MGIRYSSLDPLTKAQVDPFAEAPALAVTYNGESKQVPYPDFLESQGLEYVTQPGHTFIVGDAVLKQNDGTYTLAQALPVADIALINGSDATGIVTAIGTGADIDKFIVQFNGKALIGEVAAGRYTTSLTVGAIYYLSSSTAGEAETTVPTSGAVNRPMFVAISTTEVYIIDDRASVQAESGLINFTQDPGDFVLGDAVRYDAGSAAYVKAIATSVASATGVGVIVKKDSGDYSVAYSGWANIGGVSGSLYASFSPGVIYFLSSATAGETTSVEPARETINKPVLLGMSTTSALILTQHAYEVPVLPYTDFTQASPSFSIGHAVRRDAGSWELADNTTTRAAATAIGLITRKVGNNYRVTHSGPATIGAVVGGAYPANLTVGGIYYLGASGVGSTSIPAAGTKRKELFVATSTTEAMILASPVQDSVERWVSADITIADGVIAAANHGLAARPDMITALLRCVTPQHGYVADDIVRFEDIIANYPGDAGNPKAVIWADAAQVGGVLNGTAYWQFLDKGSATFRDLIAGNWKLILIAYNHS